MKCSITTCVKHLDCGILDITKKQPKSSDKCSYYESEKQLEKKEKKLAKLNSEIESKKLNLKKKKGK